MNIMENRTFDKLEKKIKNNLKLKIFAISSYNFITTNSFYRPNELLNNISILHSRTKCQIYTSRTLHNIYDIFFSFPP